jgi:UDP-2-acetamido-3-amino-2,3-dideoxy-glucuronate N-acetyltransferase
VKTVADVRTIPLRAFPGNGTLTAIDLGDLPFAPARLFTVDGTAPGSTRGAHAHVRCQHILICQRGRVEVDCHDGASSATFVLDSPATALFVPATIWFPQRYPVADTLLLALADRPYEADDYLGNWEAFLAFRRGGGR